MKSDYSTDFKPPALLVPIKVSQFRTSNFIGFKGLIDTGATRTVIPDQLLNKLNLRPMGRIKAKGVFDTVESNRPTYYITLYINGIGSYDLEVISGLNENILIGRDILQHLVLYANGPSRKFEIKLQD